MTNSTAPPGGVYVPCPTFFAKKGSEVYTDALAPPLDLETQLQHSLHLAKSGIRGLVLLGSTGEAVHLSLAERKELLSYIRKGLTEAGYVDYPIIAGTASNSLTETVTMLEDAKAAGAGWGLVLVPSYFAGCMTQTGIIDWYTRVADLSPIPIMIYYYPGVSNNVVVTTDTITTLAAHPNIVGAKFSHGNIAHHIIVANDPTVKQTGFATFTGLGQQLLPVLTVGCPGAIDGLAAFFPKAVVSIYDLFQQGKYEKAREVQAAVSAAEELVVKHGTVGIKEAVSRILGFGDKDGCRAPLHGGIPDGDKEWAKWSKILDAVAAYENAL